jgi:two-component system sensor histidine kinase HydH
MAETRFSLPGDADRLADLGRMAGALVHEIKNPLGVVLLNAELMQSQNLARIADPAERERVGKRLARIVDASRSLQAVVQSFLAFARPARPDPEAVDLNQLLAGLIEEQAESNRAAAVAVAFHPDPLLAALPADATHLRSVFRNVLINARDALLERAGERHLVVLTRHAPGAVRVVLANNGPPIPPNVAAHLFEPFTSAKEGGTGLGLAIVKRLVELHRGTVAVSNDPQQGVSFTFEFPTTLGPAQHLAQLPAPAPDPAPKSRPRRRRQPTTNNRKP